LTLKLLGANDLMAYSSNIVTVYLSALAHNMGQVKKLIGPKTRIMGIVKSDAYGHGLIPVSRFLEKSRIDCLGVAHLHEALELRNNGIMLPVVILCGIQSREESEIVVDKDFKPVIFDFGIAEVLDQEAIRKKKQVTTYLKLDTGMGRLGIPHADAGPFIKRLSRLKGLCLEGLTSHLSSADEPDLDFTKDQIRHFKQAVDTGRTLGLDLPLNHLANSAGIMAHRDSHFDMVRPGIMLYGGLPSPEFTPPLPLKSAMQFTGRILQIREFPDRAFVSYGRTYSTKGRQRLAVTSAGYGDGLLRSLSNKGEVLIRGMRANIVGRVCMNMTICDITHIKDVRPGDEVVFLGTQGNEHVSGDDMARWADTISYEIFCLIGQIATRDYVK
jgi:alanine racemase